MAISKKKQRQQRKRVNLPLRKVATKKTAKQKPAKKGIQFPKDQIAQDHIQTIIIEILRKWRQCKPKRKDGEPRHGSLSELVR